MLQKDSLVTVAVVYHNAQAYIGALLSSIREVFEPDDFSRFEFLFINNASTDTSEKKILDWIKENSLITAKNVNRKVNHMSLARTQALELSQSQWVAFIDSDTTFKENWPYHVIKVLEDTEDSVSAIGGGSDYENKYMWQKFAIELSKYFPLGRKQAQKIKVDHVPTNNYLVRRAKALEVGGFDPFFQRVGEDLEFNVRLRKKGQIVYNPIFSVNHVLPETPFQWYSKMAYYGRAQSYVLLHQWGGVPKEKFIPLFLCLLFYWLLIFYPNFSFIGFTLLMLIPRTRFFTLTFLFYGLGELVGFFKYYYLKAMTNRAQLAAHQNH